MKDIFIKLLKKLPAQPVFAHCDIPCGIYDPHQAQVAAHTVIRMTELIQGLHEEGEDEKLYLQTLIRHTKAKEDHAEIVKNEVRIIWGDYFKDEQIKKEYPNLSQLVFEIMKLASKTKQEINLEAAEQLLIKVQEFAEIFYKSKGLEPVKIASYFPTKREIVTYKMQ